MLDDIPSEKQFLEPTNVSRNGREKIRSGMLPSKRLPEISMV